MSAEPATGSRLALGVMEPGSEANAALTEARAALDVALIGSGAPSGQLVLGSLDDLIRQPLPAESANSVRGARRYVASLLAEVAKIDGDHMDEVVLAASELVTNAIRHTTGQGQSSIRPRWTHLYVADPDPTVPTFAPAVDDDLALSGRACRSSVNSASCGSPWTTRARPSTPTS